MSTIFNVATRVAAVCAGLALIAIGVTSVAAGFEREPKGSISDELETEAA